MILLDTDHVSILRMPRSERQTRLVERMALASHELFAIPIVVVEETMRGWLAAEVDLPGPWGSWASGRPAR